MAAIQGIIIPEEGAPCASVIAYHKRLKDKFGRQNAKEIWLYWWQKRGSWSCKTDSDFVKYFKKNGIDIEDSLSGGLASISNIGSNILGFGETATKVIRIGVPVVAGLSLVYIAWLLYKVGRDVSGSDVVNIGTAVATKGRVQPQTAPAPQQIES